MNQIEQFVQETPRGVTTSTILIAERFGKLHKDVLKAIKKLNTSEEFNKRNFAPIKYVDVNNRTQPAFEVTRDGFMLLVMGFTGDKATVIKEAFVNAFSEMEKKLNQMITKPMSQIDMVIASALAFKAMEEKQLQIESTVQKQDNRLIEIESRVLGSQNGQPLSALGYLRINGHPSDSSTVLKFGMKSSKMAKELGITAFKVSDPRYGSVNAFYAEFYDQVAEEFFNANGF